MHIYIVLKISFLLVCNDGKSKQIKLCLGEALCRLLTQQISSGLSPSNSSQTGTDSGVEDIYDDYGNDVSQNSLI